MWKKNKGYIALTALITALPSLIGLLLWDRLPDSIPTHFDFQGVADGWSSKPFAVFALPAFMLIIHLICLAGTMADPRKQNIHTKIFRMVMWICPVVSLFTCGTIYLLALGMEVNMTHGVTVMMGLLFIIVGNYLPKCRQNYTVGIKLPWTLADTENWDRTHRFAGKLWVICGIVVLFTPFLKSTGTWVMMASFAVMILLPTGYSLLYYLKHQHDA